MRAACAERPQSPWPHAFPKKLSVQIETRKRALARTAPKLRPACTKKGSAGRENIPLVREDAVDAIIRMIPTTTTTTLYQNDT